MSSYRTVTVKAKIIGDKINASPKLSGNEIRASANLTNETRTISTLDYELLNHKPQIENVELMGNKSFDDLGLTNISNMEIEFIIR